MDGYTTYKVEKEVPEYFNRDNANIGMELSFPDDDNGEGWIDFCCLTNCRNSRNWVRALISDGILAEVKAEKKIKIQTEKS